MGGGGQNGLLCGGGGGCVWVGRLRGGGVRCVYVAVLAIRVWVREGVSVVVVRGGRGVRRLERGRRRW